MANPPNQQQTPEQEQPREAREDVERHNKPPGADEAKEGMPGYGQPPEEVREKPLPEQKW